MVVRSLSLKWYFYNEENAVDNLVTPYFITDIQPTNEELLKPHIVSNIQIANKEKQRTIVKVNVLTKELVITYENISLTPNEKLELEKKRNTLQEEQINTSLMANVELFEMILSMQENTRSRNINLFNLGGSSSMVEVYTTLIIKGLKRLDEVPMIIRPQVEAQLKALGVLD